ncbi:MAG: glycosyltransferase family 4 protein [Coriobacteriia bacterium]|nr:glycosyltransferase family 4 protein [Coriobacteriia bacterium]
MVFPMRKNSDIKVVMLISNNLEIDARVRKEAQAVSDAGFNLTVVGIGKNIPEDLVDADYKLVLIESMYKGKTLCPRLGQEDIWYPVRVLVNLTVTRYRQRQFGKIYRENARFPDIVAKPEMVSVALVANPDIIHCHDLDTLWAGYNVAKSTGAKLIYDSHEIYLELRFLDPILRSQFAEVESEVFPKIDAFITVSPAIGRVLTQKYQSDIEPVVVYNGGTHIVDTASLVARLPKLFFQGYFATDRNNIQLIKAMDKLRGKATLTLQGWGQDEDAYKRLIKEMKLEETVCLIPPCGPLDVVASASHYDVGIINSIGIDENFKNTLPNKLFDYMCAGLAIASTDLPPIKEIIDENGCGMTYEQKGVNHTAEVLLGLVSEPDRIFNMKKASLKAAEKFVWPRQAEKLTALYNSLACKIEENNAN